MDPGIKLTAWKRAETAAKVTQCADNVRVAMVVISESARARLFAPRQELALALFGANMYYSVGSLPTLALETSGIPQLKDAQRQQNAYPMDSAPR